MLEQDYIMKRIKEIVRALIKLLCNRDIESPAADLLENKEEKELLESLLDMADNGNINEAENCLYESIHNNRSGIEAALLFYSHLNDKTDEFLEENNFSREEIKAGIEQVTERFGLSEITKMFLSDV